ncbi:acyl-CoA Delta(11) desaturase-like isoform X2 [Agrilus planipennis]|nr:acyl-CoA Delta(11) desaturase-like isoform X2 [Agrilus planipennis]XP_025830431.1 acyl-CoA Delta(11) desaturase-like isoform X2 [Agrilus planipennis]XP_025830432.1 acyl-CoA Delta(11) desaturase-like isoform X2 [Agrilus planipennis]XP_025830433.1 acyl-CoA Delta(11) desaturase-like isoform X2 [Agrilus planipennis]
MAPNVLGSTALFLTEATTTSEEPVVLSRTSTKVQPPSAQASSRSSQKLSSQQPHYKWDIVWRNVLAFIYLHVGAVYGLYLFIFKCYWSTFIWTYFVAYFASQGITAGAHRLWAHRSYKAKLPLRIILMIAQTVALQNHLYEWVRDHRVHHKFTDTDADPHNARRGFFFSHMGWLMVRKHKDVMIKGKTVDMSDMEEDPVVRFQRRYYLILTPIFCFLIPSLVPWYFFGEDWWTAWYVSAIFRYTVSLNCTWLVNSAAHIWGTKPYDKTISPTENVHVAFWAFGEGWHNYHHVFPWDYKAAELGNYALNFSTMTVDFFAKIGWAYDLKTASVEMVRKRAKRTGDGTRDSNEEIQDDNPHMHGGVWGWGDKDMKPEDIEDVRIYNRLPDDS